MALNKMSGTATNSDFQNALSALQAGKLGDAVRQFDAVLRVEPKHVGALNLMGVVFTQLGRFTEAETYYRRALEHQPPSDTTLYNYGIVLKVLNRPAEALQRFSEAVSLNPSVAETWNHRGTTLHDLNRYEEAIADFDKATALNPHYAEAFQNKGKSLIALKRGDEALDAFGRALAIYPSLAEAWLGCGHAFGGVGQYEQALSAYGRALALNPNLAEACLGRGHVFAQLQLYDDALAAYDRAVALKPYLAEPWLVSGLMLGMFGNRQRALSAFERALALDPNLSEAWIGRGNILLQLQKYDNALAAYDRAVALNANFAEAWLGRADVLVHLNQPDKALAAFDRALALKPDREFAQGGRLHAKLAMSDWTNLEAEVADIVAAVKAGKLAASPFHFIGLSSSAADQLACAKRVMAKQPSLSRAWRGEIYSHDRVRIAYLSPDIPRPGAQLVVGMFEHHDKSRFEIMALSYGLDDASDLRNRIQSAAENFIDIRTMTDQEVAEFIRRREIDVIVDLTGPTALYNRFSVLSRHVAPIQVNFLGYAGTTGADWMDYIIADRTIIPEDYFRCYSEQVVWLPDTYQPNDNKRLISERLPTRAECNLPETVFVFCCFNTTYKITPEVFAVWMKLLAAIEGSVLWLIESNPTAVQNLRKAAKARGISPERLIFAPKLSLADHLSRHRQADVFLDTLPYNAHTTASDALWAGVPIVTRLGATFAGRVAASLLKAIGLPELITSSLEDYEAVALKLAREPSFLASIKAKLARNRDFYPLFDTARFTRHIEAAYTTMWRRYQNGAAPQAFAVDPVD
ncbi:MAG TPA: tetratricopeptide repeat protein [Pseudolabrys sp.]|nr:tetratricopeptide repeat protein [Pseudolabrys sp.]